MNHQLIFRASVWMLFLMSNGFAVAAERPIDFNRDIRPLLSNNCFTCHGPDDKKRKADLRLDIRGALGDPENSAYVVPGEPEKSELYLRVISTDPDSVMPPPSANHALTDAQKNLLRDWIAQGATYDNHWSFVRPVMPEVPAVRHAEFPRNEIDYFTLARMEAEGLAPSSEADKVTLIRRVTFALTGLPPTPAEVDAFLADTSADAYEKVVDRLLDSPAYGEHMCRYWLDVARYGDTHGLHLDNERSLWLYRDWVINAFNRNMPFDRFTIEQLAGDLLPEPTLEQRVATGFNRCNVTTSEGGSIDEEYYVRYAVDRVETTSTVWMGLTMGCAVCHEHKYDPISQREFYQLFAYFYSLTERAMDGNALLPPPIVKVPTPEQAEELASLQSRLPVTQQKIQEALAGVEYVEPETPESVGTLEPKEYVWIDDALPTGAQPQGNDGPEASWKFVTAQGAPVFSGEKSHTRTSKGLSQHFFTGANPTLHVGEGDKFFAYVYLDPANPPREIMLQWNDGSWEHRAIWGENLIEWGSKDSPARLPMGELPKAGEWVRLEVDAAKVGLTSGKQVNGWAFTQFDGTVYWDKAGIITKTPQSGTSYESLLVWEKIEAAAEKPTAPPHIIEIIKKPSAERSDDQRKQLQNYFVENVYSKTREIFAPLQKERDEIQQQIAALDQQIAATLVMEDLPQPKQTFVLTRGEYDKPDKEQEVFPDVPGVLPALPEGAPRNRLTLAKWLVDPTHPLTARVAVNRFWQQYFGMGIVRTTEDFGSQGEWPSHPELLDWLAIRFIESGWDIKAMQRLIVTSATFRQSARVTDEQLEHDPENILLSRGPRHRMDAEMIRDNMLAISGLLVRKIGGKSVRPYQPDGIWEAVAFTGSNTMIYNRDEGNSLFRRSMYTFWKRTAPPPSMTTFDAPSREACTVKRARTNTPLQALALMNDEQYVEAARHLARRMMTEASAEPSEKIAHAFKLATAREPSEREQAIFDELYRAHKAEFDANPEEAMKLVSVGTTERNETLDVSELAAWTMIANLIMNLDETITN